MLKRLKRWLPTHPVTLALAIGAGGLACAALWFLLGGQLLAAFIYANLHSNFKKPVMTPPEIYVEIGESPAALESRYGKIVEANKKNFDVEFHRVDWPSDTSGVIVIKNGTSAVRLDTALGVMGTYNSAYPDEGFMDYDISLGIAPRNNIPHDQARQKLFSMLQDIQRAGWHRWIEPNHPRLSGEYAYHYQVSRDKQTFALDPNYMPSMAVWMKLKDQSEWAFYLNDVFMDVYLTRDSSKMNPDLPGSYFINVALHSKNENQRLELVGDDRKKWRELYPEIRKKQAETRSKEEKKLQSLNFEIDTKYKNPDE